MMESIRFMYFWLNYSDKNNHIEKIISALKNIDQLLCMVIK